jgi:hypothetical protein
MAQEIKVADEVWVATALLHREQPGRQGFFVREIVDRAAAEHIATTLRPGVTIHASQHCVANKRPNPGRYRMLFETSHGIRRLYRIGDYHHPHRNGKQTPDLEELPSAYQYLLDWYNQEYNRPPQSEDITESDLASIQDSFFERLHAMWNSLPEEELCKLPRDGAANHDRYIRASRS